MKRDVSVERCSSCGQLTWKTTAQSSKRHLETIERIYGFTLEELKFKRGPALPNQARQHYWFLLVIEDYWSLARAGSRTGHKHHAVLYGIRKFATEHIKGCHFKMNIQDIRIAYYRQAGYSEEEIEDLI